MKKRTQIIIFVVLLLLIGGIGAGYIIHKHSEAQQGQKEKELKVIEDEIVADLAKRYKGVKSVQFEEYSITPMGTLTFTVSINHKNFDNYSEDYDIDLNSDNNHPRLSGYSKKSMAEKGTSGVKKIKVTYNFNEFGK